MTLGMSESWKRRKRVFLILLMIISISFLLLTISINTNNSRVTKEFQKMEMIKIKIVNDEGRVLEFEVKVADEPDEWIAGFQNISRSVIEKTLILFVFPSETKAFFHMHNVEASLDIAFIKADGTIVEIMQMHPNSNKLYSPKESFKYAIEAREGFFESIKVTAGRSRLIIE